MEDNGQQFVPEERNWEDFKTNPFKTQKMQYVVCLNTMGQDRQFTADEIKYAIETVKFFKECWQNRDQVNVEHDVAYKI